MIASIVLAVSILVIALVYDIVRNRKVRFRTVNLLPGNERASAEENALSILHISDIHLKDSDVGSLKAFEALAERQWDFIFITGDLTDNDSGIGPLAEALKGMRASYGKYAVLGNHDYFLFKADNPYQWFRIFFGAALKGRHLNFCQEKDITLLVRALQNNGIRVLQNQVASGLFEGGGKYQVFGIDDPSTDRDNPAPLYGCVDHEALRMVLIHSPQRLASIQPFRPDLVLCGHTHGGQIRIPFLGAVATHSDAKRKSAAGIVLMEGCRVHISPGMGCGSIFPFRILAPPELTEILIEKKSILETAQKK
ncbi:MAG TPA: metallophosphoesterase [archaeon]|nr:metallophosphoesterase [archaeon]